MALEKIQFNSTPSLQKIATTSTHLFEEFGELRYIIITCSPLILVLLEVASEFLLSLCPDEESYCECESRKLHCIGVEVDGLSDFVREQIFKKISSSKKS